MSAAKLSNLTKQVGNIIAILFLYTTKNAHYEFMIQYTFYEVYVITFTFAIMEHFKLEHEGEYFHHYKLMIKCSLENTVDNITITHKNYYILDKNYNMQNLQGRLNKFDMLINVHLIYCTV